MRVHRKLRHVLLQLREKRTREKERTVSLIELTETLASEIAVRENISLEGAQGNDNGKSNTGQS